jgi:Putative auto-transporter adhesin, head GIN domain
MKNNIIYLPALFLVFFLNSCYIERHISGEGRFTGEKRDITAYFNKIRVECAANITLRQGDTVKVSVKDYENLLTYLKTEVRDSTLIIDYKDVNPLEWSGADIDITVPQISNFDISGKCNVRTAGNFNFEDLKIYASGMSNFTLRGSAQHLTVDISGMGYAYLFEMPCETAKVDLSGTGRAELNVKNNLKVNISGIGRVMYKGTPSVTKSVSGIGRVKSYL